MTYTQWGNYCYLMRRIWADALMDCVQGGGLWTAYNPRKKT